MALIVVALAAAACSGDTMSTHSNAGPTTGSGATSASLAGKYKCLHPEADSPDAVELRADGTLSITAASVGQTFEGKWTAQGTSGAFGPGTPDEEKFTVQDGKIVFEDTTTCTRVASPTIAGTYRCALDPPPTPGPGPETWIFEDGGKLTATASDGSKTETTWRIDQGQLVVRINMAGDRFTIEPNRFVFAGPSDGGPRFICNRQG